MAMQGITLATKKEVMEEFEQRLEQIRTENGYNYTLQFIERQQTDPTGMDYSYPGVFLNELEMESERLLLDLYRHRLQVAVIGWVYSETDLADALTKLEEDVMAAMTYDTTLTGLVEWVKPSVVFYRPGQDYRGPLAAFGVAFEAQFYSDAI